MDPRALLVDWEATAGTAGARGELRPAGRGLLDRWSEPHRAYHDVRHLAEVLERLDPLQRHATAPVPVRLAAWFHDAVYDPRRDDSEERSAELAADVLAALSVPAPAVAEVRRLVLLTRSHTPAPGDRDGEVLCDGDLGILAAAPQRYAEYVRDVRREYAHLPEATFAEGRRAVVRRLLASEPLFRTPTGAGWEGTARENLRRELLALNAGEGRADRSG